MRGGVTRARTNQRRKTGIYCVHWTLVSLLCITMTVPITQLTYKLGEAVSRCKYVFAYE